MPRDVAAYICSLLLSLAFCAGLSKQQQQPQAPLLSANSSSAVDKSRVNQTTATPVVQGPAKVQVGSAAIVTCSVNVSMELHEDYHVRWDTTSLKTSIFEANSTRTATGYLLVLTIHSAAVGDLFDKPVLLCINEGPLDKVNASWTPQAIAPPQMPVIAGPKSLQKNTNITAACSTRGALGMKPDVTWLDVGNNNVTAYETSGVLTNVTIEKIPYWNVTAFLQPALDGVVGNKTYVCQVTHSETESVFKKEYTFEVRDDVSNGTSSGDVSNGTADTKNSGRGEGAREFTEGLSWLLRRVKRTPGSEDDPTDDNNDLSSHANETFNGMKEVDNITNDVEIPFLKPEKLKNDLGSPTSKRSFQPNSLVVWSPDKYQGTKHVYTIIGVVFLSTLVILGVVTYLRRNNANCYCC
ncbi:uncharacterized protein LOC112560774 isoform X2 [Pomacea canaliculata]|uniref:uncharacterized protein LOC112560774 isoform X2 n=1 Tax=Pomacea canaliculata TaxID=400727 RepID=UPI000D7255EC|nr:uncharacterized protein LOC112560774 isoform X2 [Pomacea canaliculata]